MFSFQLLSVQSQSKHMWASGLPPVILICLAMIITPCNKLAFSLSSNSEMMHAATVSVCFYGTGSVSLSLGLDDCVSFLDELE